MAFGIAKIAAPARTYAGITFEGDTIVALVAMKLAHPLASNKLISQLSGKAYSTVCGALSTPYAKGQLESIQERMPLYAKRLEQAQGDSVEFWHDVVVQGSKGLRATPLDSQLTGHALRASEMIGRATGMLTAESLTIRHELASMADLDDEALALDPSLATVLDDEPPTDKGEGETPTPPVDA